MGIKSSLTCDRCNKDVPMTDHFAQLTINAHEMKWEDENYDSPFRVDVDHVAQMEGGNETKVMCMPCGKAMLKTLERELRNKGKAEPERPDVITYELVDALGKPVDLRDYERVNGTVYVTDLMQNLEAARTLTLAGIEVVLREVRT